MHVYGANAESSTAEVRPANDPPKTLDDSLKEHLKLLTGTLFSVLGLDIAVGVGGVLGGGKWKFGSFEFAGDQAYYFAAGAFLLLFLLILAIFLRLRDMLDERWDYAIVAIFDSFQFPSALLSPFARFGTRRSSRSHSCLGIFVLVLSWWLSLAAMTTVSVETWASKAIAICFGLIGGASLLVADRIHRNVASGMERVGRSDYAAELRTMRNWRFRAGLAAASCGFALFVAALAFRASVPKSPIPSTDAGHTQSPLSGHTGA